MTEVDPALPNSHEVTGATTVDEPLRDSKEPSVLGIRGASHEELEAVLEGLSEGVIVADKDGTFVFYNASAVRILGVHPSQVNSGNRTGLFGLYRADGTTPYRDDELPLARALQGDVVKDELICVRNPARPKGVWITVSASPITDVSGSNHGGWAVFRDVTRLQDALEGLEKSARVLEQTADSVVITNTQGVIDYVNPAFEITTGFGSEEVIGQTPAVLGSGKHDRAHYRELWDTIKAGETWRGTIINKKKGGEIYWTEQSITPMKSHDGTVTSYVSVQKDLTEFMRQQEQEFQVGLARQVQQRYYSPRIHVPGFDIAGAADPADETGGDYFDFIPMPNGSFAIVVGDISGHGLGAALVLAELRAFLRAFAKTNTDPAAILSRLNRELVSDLEDDRFATLIMARVDPRKRSLVYANAGHVPAYLLNRDGDVVVEMGATAAPLGILSDYAVEDSEPIQLGPDNILAFFTDGILEAESSEGEQFGLNRACDAVKRHRGEAAVQIVRSLHEEVRLFSASPRQDDDVTSVICKAGEPRRVAAAPGDS
jgi:sigma-B regulation protein RsbU (phosphoserine phosphatase)